MLHRNCDDNLLLHRYIPLFQLEELNRKLYQSELRSETLVTAIEELKSQHESEKERYKRDLGDFHERVTTQKEQLSRSLKELEDLKIKYLETKKQKLV